MFYRIIKSGLFPYPSVGPGTVAAVATAPKWAPAIIAGIASLIGGGAKAIGGHRISKEEEREKKRLEKLSQERWEEEQKLAERSTNLAGLQQLAEQRYGALEQSRKRSFKNNLLTALRSQGGV